MEPGLILKLIAKEAIKEDIGKNVVRMGYPLMEKVGISCLDLVEICGEKSMHAHVLPTSDKNETTIIRMDKLCRENAGIDVGDYVVIRKAKNIPLAEEIVLRGDKAVTISEELLKQAKYGLAGLVFKENDRLLFPVSDANMILRVESITPKPAARLTRDTNFTIK